MDPLHYGVPPLVHRGRQVDDSPAPLTGRGHGIRVQQVARRHFDGVRLKPRKIRGTGTDKAPYRLPGAAHPPDQMSPEKPGCPGNQIHPRVSHPAGRGGPPSGPRCRGPVIAHTPAPAWGRGRRSGAPAVRSAYGNPALTTRFGSRNILSPRTRHPRAPPGWSGPHASSSARSWQKKRKRPARPCWTRTSDT
jgi:hypothetical protein